MKKSETTDLLTPERGRGRPTDYSAELADLICERIIKGMSVRKIGDMDDMPCEDTIYTWLARHRDFSEKYNEAVQHRTTKYMDECVDLADNMPDGVMFIAGNGNLYTRDEVLQLNAQERAMAGLQPIGLSTELINKRRLQIETRLKAAARMHPRKWGERTFVESKNDNTNVNVETTTTELRNAPDAVISALANVLKESGLK